jgi:hypothetical protein
MGKPNDVTNELKNDPTKRAQFLAKLSALLRDMGLSDDDIQSLDTGPGDPKAFVLISRSRSTESIIVA